MKRAENLTQQGVHGCIETFVAILAATKPCCMRATRGINFRLIAK